MNLSHCSWLQKLILLIASLMLGACSFLSHRNFALLTTTSDSQVRVAQQQWRIQKGEDNYSLEIIVERSTNHWRWIVLNNLGQRIATVECNGEVNIERLQSHPVNQLLPEILQAWQLSYWPITDLQASDSRWTIIETIGHRNVLFSGILHAAIKYQQTEPENPWQGSLSYHSGELRLNIDSQLLN